MYEEFLESILYWLKIVNAADNFTLSAEGTCYLAEIPLMFDGEVVGHLRDEIGGAWSYHPIEREPPNDRPNTKKTDPVGTNRKEPLQWL